jgi:hypothetical protein
MLRVLAILFGILFIFIGVAGFMPNFYSNELLFGYLSVDSMHNFVHLITGVLAIMAATRYSAAKVYFCVFGIIFILLALLGFWRNDFYMMHMNLGDNIFHLIVGLIFAYLGFSAKSKPHRV